MATDVQITAKKIDTGDIRYLTINGDNIDTVNFHFPRYYNGKDLSLGTAQLLYKRPDGTGDADLLTVTTTETEITASWDIRPNFTCLTGKAYISVRVVLESNLWQSFTAPIIIERSIAPTDLQCEPTVFDQYLYLFEVIRNDTVSAKEDAEEAAETAVGVIENPSFVIVSEDLALGDLSNIKIVAGDIDNINAVVSNKTNIDTVAINIDNVNAVGDNIAHVINVDNNSANINAVVSNKTNIDTVAINIDNVNTVSDNIVNVNAVALNEANINAVSTNITHVQTVSDNMDHIVAVENDLANIDIVSTNITKVNTVADNIAHVQTVSTDIADINAVSANSININKVAAIDTDVTSVSAIDAQISALALITAEIVNVNAISTEVTTVSANMLQILGVYAKLTEITAVYGKIPEIDALYAQLDTIAAKANQADLDAVADRLDTLEGTGEGSVAKAIDDAVTPIDTRVTYLESVRGHLYGVRMQKISGICSPTYDAIGLEFRPQIDTITNPSDFSSVYPWRDIKTVKVDADKNILCTIDDANFESTVGDIMVKIPVFWHRYWTDANYEYYEISDTPRDGFFAGGFYNPDGTIKPYALVGAVKTSNDGRVPHSWTDTSFTHSLPLYSTTAGFQLDALDKSSVSKWSNIDHQAYEMVWHLIFVEIGGYVISPNSQVLGFDVKGAIGQGINGMTNSYSESNVCTVATTDANTFIIAKTQSQYFKVGMLVQIGTAHTSQDIAANRYITDISEYDATNDVITVDGATFTTTITSTIATWAQPLPLAQLMALKNESGYVLQFGANDLSHVCYRGIWDLWGNLYEFMSGLYRYDLQFYACFDWTKMNVNDPRGVAGWVATGIAPDIANGYLKTRKVYKGALGEIGLPSAVGAGSATWYAAYAYYFNSGYMGLRAVRCGGNWSLGATVGFLWSGLFTPTGTNLNLGGRLIG